MSDTYEYSRLKHYEEYFQTTMDSFYDLTPFETLPVLKEIMKTVTVNLSAINNKLISPLSKITAEDYNDFWQAVAIDLKTAYQEVDALVNIYNNVSNKIKTKTMIASNSINAAFSKARSLKQLNSSDKTFDHVYFNTFINENNTYPMQDQLVVPEDSGLMRLMSLETTPIVKDDNDANISYVVPNQCLLTNVNIGNITSSNVDQSSSFTIVSNEPLSETFPIGSSDKEQHNGAVLGTIVNFPSIRKINNIFFKPYSNAELTIEGIYYSTKEIITMNHYSWIKIEDIEYDTSNYNSYEFNFEPISAKTVMIVLTQSHHNKKEIVIDKDSIINGNTTFTNSTKLESDTIKKMREYTEILNKVLSYSTGKLDNKLTGMLTNDDISIGFGKVTDILKRLMIGIENLLVKKDTITLDSYIYKIGLYGLHIYHNDYTTAGTYQSELFSYNRAINSVRLLANHSIPTDSDGKNINIIRYSLVFDDIKIPMIPYNKISQDVSDKFHETEYQDFVLIKDSKQLTYPLSFLAYSETIGNEDTDFIVKKGSKELTTPDDYTLSNNIGYDYYNEIVFNTNIINTGDIIKLQYQIPRYDKDGYNYDPSMLYCDKYFGKPNIIDRHLFEGSSDYVTLSFPFIDLNETFNNTDVDPTYKSGTFIGETGLSWDYNDCSFDGDTSIILNNSATADLTINGIPLYDKITIEYSKVLEEDDDVNLGISIDGVPHSTILSSSIISQSEEIDLTEEDGTSINFKIYNMSGGKAKIVSIIAETKYNKKIYKINDNITRVKKDDIIKWEVAAADMPIHFRYDEEFIDGEDSYYFPLLSDGLDYTITPNNKFNYHGISKESIDLTPHNGTYNSTNPMDVFLLEELDIDDEALQALMTANKIRYANTEHSYIPGSISVYNSTNTYKTLSYTNDTVLIITEEDIELTSLLCSYTMFDIDVNASNYINNIAKHNSVENHNGILKTNTIILNNTPLIDTAIMEQTINDYWVNSNGVFISREDTDIIYEPIQILINNKSITNKTDYISNSTVKLDNYSLSLNNKQFYQLDNKLIFNFNTSETLMIKYYKSNQRFKTQIEIVNHNRTNINRTSEIYDYSTIVELM